MDTPELPLSSVNDPLNQGFAINQIPDPTLLPKVGGEQTGSAINLYSSLPIGTVNGLTGKYYNNSNDLGLIRTDTTVDFNWGNGSPNAIIRNDNFRVNWTGLVQPLYSEIYNFYTQSDDGVRLAINDQLVIDKWQDQSTKEHSGSIFLEAGKLYNIDLDYYEKGGQAVSKLLWSSDSQVKQIIPTSQLYSTLPQPIETGTGNGLTSKYYNNTNFTDLGVIRTDAQINFDWGNGSPDVNIDKDTFSVISSGKIQPLYSDKYTFYTQSDDGVQLFINGQVIIDQWKNQSVTEHKGTITLEAGKVYHIEYKYYENSGLAVSKLLWSSDSQVKQIIPTSQLYSTLPTPYKTGFGTTGFGAGLRGEYFDNKDLTNSKLVRTDATIDFNWGQGSPDSSIGKDTFSATWTGFVQPLYSEKYTFSTQSDDGVRVWVNDQLLIDKWQNQSTKEYSGFINLEAGKLSKIHVDYYENGGEAVSKLFWSSDSQVKQIIPTSQLYKDNNQPLIGIIDIYANNSWLGNPKHSAINDNGFIKQDFDNGYFIWNGQNAIVYQYGTGNTFLIDPVKLDQSDARDIDKLWKVEFWDNKNLAGNPKWIQFQNSSDINFNAGIGAPPNTIGIPADNFSGRWTKTDNFKGGLYNFISEADDGVRVYIDGVKVIDKWAVIEPWSRRDGYVLIPEGKHQVVVEYFEQGGIAGQNFKWEKSNLIDNWKGDLRPVGYDGTSVHNTYVNTYQRNGDISELGYPINNVHPWENGYTQDFDGGVDGRGAIMKSNANDNSYWVGGQVWQKFLDLGGARYLGYPTTDYIDINGGLDNIDNDGGIVQHFSGNEGIPTKIWLSKHGAHPTWGAIGGKYEALGSANSFLGYPTSGEVGIGEGRVIQNFVGGTILYKQDQPTIAFTTDFWNKYQEISAWNSILGYATSEPFNTKDGQRQNFQGGAILKSDAGIFPIYGGIGGKYISLGAENSFLGFPTSSEIGIGEGWIIQHFQGGDILYKDGQPTVAYDLNAMKNLPADSGHGSTSPWVIQYWNNQDMIGNPIWTRTENPGELRFAAGVGAPPDTRGIQEDHFSIRSITNSLFEGGIYNFISQADDGIRVYVDDQLIIDKWQDQGFVTNTNALYVEPGYHTVRVEYFENAGLATNTLRWELLNPVNEWAGEFYNNQNLQGNAVGYRSGGTGFLDKNWGSGHEFGVPIGDDHFSDRWTKVDYFSAGAYEFTNTSDDGVRLFIDDQIILDKWHDQPYLTNKVLVSLDQGYHKIRLEHFENLGAAATKLSWQKTGIEPIYPVTRFDSPVSRFGWTIGERPESTTSTTYIEPWVGEYFNNRDLAGAPVITRMDGTGTLARNLDFNWGLGSPDSRINSDDFSARWTTHSYLSGIGNYTFSLTGDDGIRLYINDVKIIDKWTEQPYVTTTVPITLGSGLHKIQLEYFERGGAAAVKLDWNLDSRDLPYQPATEISGSVGEFSRGLPEIKVNSAFKAAYDKAVMTLGTSLVGVPTNTIRTELKEVSFGSIPGLPDEKTRISIGKSQEFLGTEGKFALLQQDGNSNVTYAWGELLDAYQQFGGAAILGYPVASQKDLGKGAYELALSNGKFFFAPGMTNPTYYEYVNGSLTIPADNWKAEFFNNKSWSGDPIFVSGSITPNFDWGANSPVPGVSADNFSVRWTSQKPFDRGTYRFAGTHDDNFQVIVNGQSPINRAGVGINVNGYGTFTNSGQYLVDIKYIEYSGLAYAQFGYNKASDYVVGLDINNNPNQKILDTFWQQGGYDRVGVPVNDVHPWYGLVQDFKGGANGDGIIMRQDNNSEAYYIYGDIFRVYLQNNDVAGLGYPSSNVFDDGHGNTAQNFGYNRITRQGNGETFVGGYVNGVRLDGDFYRVWNQYQLGTPESGLYNFNGMTYRYFNHPNLGRVSAVQSQYGTFPLIGGIRGYYVNVAGGLGGVLGAPTSAEYSWNGKTRQDFAGGYILWNGSAIGYKPNGSLLFPPINTGGGNGGGSGGGSGNGSQLPTNEIQTILYNFFAQYGQNWADQSFDEMWDRVGGESAQFPNGNFTSGDQWQVDMPSEIFDIYKDLSNTIFGTVNGVNTGYVYDQGYYHSYDKWHAGLDIQASQGTLVKAAIGGKVAWMNNDFIGIDGDDGNHWVYGHLGTKYVQRDQRIEISQQLARTDSANHLHLEVQHGHGYKQTLGAHANQDWLRSVTVSPIQAYWEFNKSSDNGNGGGSDANTRFQSELNEALNRIGSSITSVVKSPDYISADQGKGWIAQYKLSNGKEYFFGLEDGKNDGYWVHGDNLGEYLRLGGPNGQLGLPTNEETPFTSHTGASGIWQSFSGANGNARIHNSWITDNGGQREYVSSVATWGSIGGLYENMGGANSWLGVPTKAEWHSPDGKTIWSRFERGWIANNKDINQTEAFDFNSRPSWIKNAYEKEFTLYLNQDLPLSQINLTSPVDTTWNISVDDFLTKYGNFIKLAALYYGVSGQAIVGLIQWEYTQNSPSRERDQDAFIAVQTTGNWWPFNGTGWGKMHYTTAQKLMEQNSGLFDMDDPNDNRKLARYLAAPFSAIDLIAQELRKASQAYSKYGFEIYNNPGVLATLYRIGEKDQSYEERAKSNRQNNQYPKIETGEIDVNDLPLVEQKVTVMGKWLYDKVQKSDLISYQTFDGELEPYNYFS